MVSIFSQLEAEVNFRRGFGWMACGLRDLDPGLVSQKGRLFINDCHEATECCVYRDQLIRVCTKCPRTSRDWTKADWNLSTSATSDCRSYTGAIVWRNETCDPRRYGFSLQFHEITHVFQCPEAEESSKWFEQLKKHCILTMMSHHFQLLEQIGSGASSTVIKGIRRSPHQVVAIKKIEKMKMLRDQVFKVRKQPS
jgi:hypothetical protein